MGVFLKGEKVRLVKITEPYEKKCGVDKYIGKIGKIIHFTKLYKQSCFNERLYDVEFDDGQIWCLETKQLEKIEGEKNDY